MNLFRARSYRPFALLWSGQTLSRLGDSVYIIALAWWVLEHTGSAAAMGTVLICASVPTLLFLLVGGVAVDRLPRLAVMLVSDAMRGVVVIGVAGAGGDGHACAVASVRTRRDLRSHAGIFRPRIFGDSP